MSSEGARYRFGPRERGGALAGWRAGQILTVAFGLVVGVLILRAEPNVAGVGVAVLILAACGAMATWPVNGRPMAPGGGPVGHPASRPRRPAADGLARRPARVECGVA